METQHSLVVGWAQEAVRAWGLEAMAARAGSWTLPSPMVRPESEHEGVVVPLGARSPESPSLVLPSHAKGRPPSSLGPQVSVCRAGIPEDY